MISKKLKSYIYPYLKMLLRDDELPYIEEFFTEMYIDYDKDGNKLVALKPFADEYLTMEFSMINGAFMRMEFWEDVKKRGERIV